MPTNKKQGGDPLECGCGRTFSTVGGLTAHCQAKGHSLVLVAQFHEGKTTVNNYVLHNTEVEVHASEHGYSIKQVGGGNQANSVEAPGGGLSSFPAVNHATRPDNIPQSVPQEGAQLLENENPEPSQPILPHTLPKPNPQVPMAGQTSAGQVRRWSCPVCKKRFLEALDCYNHCLGKQHMCCPYFPMQALHLFHEHLTEVHGQNQEALQVKHEYQDTWWRTRAKTRSQKKAAYGQRVTQNSQHPCTMPQAPSSLPARPPVSGPLRQEAPVPPESVRPSPKPGVLGGGGNAATSQHESNSNPIQGGPMVGQESKAPSLTEGTSQGTSQGTLAAGNKEAGNGNESIAIPAEPTTRRAPVSVASIWQGLDVSRLRGKGSYIEKDEEGV